MRSIVAACMVGALALVGCANNDPDPSLSPVPLDTPTTESPSDPPSGDPTAFPGDPLGRAVADETYIVVGVAHDDTLNVRSGPSVDFGTIGELDPNGQAIATGDDRLHDGGLWYEVETGFGTGWVNAAFLALEGAITDVTADVTAANGGALPSAETMEALGELVASLRASDDPPSDIVVSTAATVGDLGEIVMDVIGLGDDASVGERLHVFGTPEGEGFTLKSVEATLLCGRGLDEGACV